jgi:two-component system nitrogen regulation response regulator GlnG/two-component system response regulator HydG
MRTSRTTLVPDHRADAVPAPAAATPRFGFVILWSRTESHRLGETALLEPDPDADPRTEPTFFLGRALGHAGATPLWFGQHRPGSVRLPGALMSPGISRVHWMVRATERGVAIDNIGQRALLIRNQMMLRGHAEPGDLVEIAGELLLLVVRRTALPAAAGMTAFTFGGPDAFGIVGESPAAWELRRQLAFAAARADHVLLTGPSGSGKELAARAIHSLSSRGRRPMLARNAATLPESLIDAELFGNVRDYPNVGTPERSGLIGASDDSTLFLDEIGELSHTLQAHLLRVLDGGEYQRLGEPRSRSVDVRFIAATNRSPAELKHDLLPRLRLRIAVPGLSERREDVPLIALALLRSIARGDSALARAFFVDGEAAGEPRWTSRFVAALVTSSYTGHVRELQAHLWNAMANAHDDRLDTPALARGTGVVEVVAPPDEAPATYADPRDVDVGRLREALAAAGGSRERAWRALGLRNRHQLMRLLRKYGDELAEDITEDDALDS